MRLLIPVKLIHLAFLSADSRNGKTYLYTYTTKSCRKRSGERGAGLNETFIRKQYLCGIREARITGRSGIFCGRAPQYCYGSQSTGSRYYPESVDAVHYRRPKASQPHTRPRSAPRCSIHRAHPPFSLTTSVVVAFRDST